jgi:hypothetical protein
MRIEIEDVRRAKKEDSKNSPAKASEADASYLETKNEKPKVKKRRYDFVRP